MKSKTTNRFSVFYQIKKNRTAYLFMMPFLLLFTVFVFIPIIAAVCLSFTSFDMLQTPKFLGLENYSRLFLEDDVFLIAIKNTFFFAVITGPFGYILSFVMAWFIFLPAATALMGNSRIERSYLSTLSDYFEQRAAGEKDQAFKSIRSLFVWRSGSNYYWQRYGQIFESYFFPPDIPSRVNFFDGHATRWASISMYLPMFGMAGVFSLFTVKKRTWLKVLIGILILSSFVPILNSMFFLFNSSYYARWLYMMILMFSLATTVMLEDTRSNWKIPTALMTFFCTVVAVPLGLVWHENVDLSELIELRQNLSFPQ